MLPPEPKKVPERSKKFWNSPELFENSDPPKFGEVLSKSFIGKCAPFRGGKESFAPIERRRVAERREQSREKDPHSRQPRRIAQVNQQWDRVWTWCEVTTLRCASIHRALGTCKRILPRTTRARDSHRNVCVESKRVHRLQAFWWCNEVRFYAFQSAHHSSAPRFIHHMVLSSEITCSHPLKSLLATYLN